MQISSLFRVKNCANYKNHEGHPLIKYAMFHFKLNETLMIGLSKNKSQYYTDFFFFSSYQEFLLFTQELIHFTREIVPLLSKKLRTPHSTNMRVPSYVTYSIG